MYLVEKTPRYTHLQKKITLIRRYRVKTQLHRRPMAFSQTTHGHGDLFTPESGGVKLIVVCISSLISCGVVPVKDAQKCVLSSFASIITANNTAAMVGAITPHLMVKIVSRMVYNDTLECIQTPHREYFTLQRLLIQLFLSTYSSLNSQGKLRPKPYHFFGPKTRHLYKQKFIQLIQT